MLGQFQNLTLGQGQDKHGQVNMTEIGVVA